MASDLISRAAMLNGISNLMKSPWYNNGKDGERHLQYLVRKDAVEVVKVLCIEKEPTVDAITVEWLKQQFYENPNSQWAEKCRDVFTGWQRWQRLQKEQEAQNG